MKTALIIPVACVAVLLMLACGTQPDRAVSAIQADRFDGSEWSEPVNLGPVINSSAVDANTFLSPDGHTLYFVSTRPGGLGSQDIWMSHRQAWFATGKRRLTPALRSIAMRPRAHPPSRTTDTSCFSSAFAQAVLAVPTSTCQSG